MKREFRAFAAVGLCAVLACELGRSVDGGGGPTFGPEQTVALSSTGALDGYVREDQNAQTSGQVYVGDLFVSPGYQGFRGFYSFDLASIPAGSSVTSAELRLYQLSFSGSPYADLGNLVVDHLDYGATLDTDYSLTALMPNIGTLSTNTTTEYKTLLVTSRVQADIAATRTRAQFRVRFSNIDSNNDGNADNVTLTDADWPVAASQPQLVVKYRPLETP